MDRDELIEFLKSNLTIVVDKRQGGYGGYTNSVDIIVTLKLNGEEISSSRESFVEADGKGFY